MKKVLCLLVATLMLLSGIAMAEEPSAEVCQHKYVLCDDILEEDAAYVAEIAEEGAFLASAVCSLCEDRCLIIKDKSLVVPDPCEQEECRHRLYTLPDFHRTSWRPVTNAEGETFHQRVECDVGVCLDCGFVAAVYTLKETGEHRMEEKPGFHIEGQYIHADCQECSLCGLMTGALVPCVLYEDGSCDRLPAQK